MRYNELTVLLPCHGLEDFPEELGETDAASLLNAFAILWHPLLLASAEKIPKWERADESGAERLRRLVIVPTPCAGLVSEEWKQRAQQDESVVISGEHDRKKLLGLALAPLVESAESVPDAGSVGDASLDPELVADFLAFGTVHLQTQLLARRMRNFSQVDEQQLRQEALAAAYAAVSQDGEAARKHLGHCFEMLLECRERFYPVDCFLLDLCLLTPEFANDNLAKLLGSSSPVNLLAPAADWKTIVDQDVRWIERIKAALNAGTLELIGGDDRELPTTLMSLDSTLYHLGAGRELLHDLFGVRPVIWGRKRFGLGQHLPQLLKRLGYTGGLHVVLDSGLYPDEEETQLRWEGNGGVILNAFSRIPVAADSASSLLRFPSQMGETMDRDHTAAVAFARWPDLRTPFLEDFRRAHRYAPVLGNFVTFSDFFGRATSPGRLSHFKSGEYFSPTLVRSVAGEEPDPISRFVRYWETQRAFQRADWLHGVCDLMEKSRPAAEEHKAVERIAEEAHPESSVSENTTATEAINAHLDAGIQRIQKFVTTNGEPGDGVLVVNPLSFPRKTLIEWPAGSVPPKHPQVLHRQIDADRGWAFVELPPCGFLWLSAESHLGDTTSPGKPPLAEDLMLRNELFEVRLSDVTGGIAQVLTYRRSPNRISQQVALRFPREKFVTLGEGEDQESIQTFYTAMQLRESRIVCEGPLIGEIETLGDLLDEQSNEVLGSYRQRTRVVRGRPVIEVDLEVAAASMPAGDPWTNYIGCRFAWKHEGAVLSASMQQGAQPVSGKRIEAPHFLEIADDDFRTTILTPGLTFHRQTGERMLDTLLIVAGEREGRFRFAVAVDARYPMQACLDQFSPPIVVPTRTAPPDGSAQGWFFNVSAANVQLTRVLPGATENSVIVRLLETEGRARVFGLYCFRTPKQARQIDFQGETISELRLDDAVNVEISPYELCDVELTF